MGVTAPNSAFWTKICRPEGNFPTAKIQGGQLARGYCVGDLTSPRTS